jgi:hypothetical protein
MRIFKLIAVAMIAMLFTLAPALAQRADDSGPALEFIQKTGMSKNFLLLVGQSSVQTQTFKIIAANYGIDGAKSYLIAAMTKALPKYEGEWNRVMARIWAKHLSVEEMNSLTTLGQRSPFFQKLMAAQEKVGPEMQSELQPLLNSAVADSIAIAFEESSARQAK